MQCLQLQHLVEVIIVHAGVGGVGGVAYLQVGVVQVWWRGGALRARAKFFFGEIFMCSACNCNI